MLSLKEYNLRLNRLKNTRKMTRTMKMVSANKLRRAQEAQKHADVFTRHFQRVSDQIISLVDKRAHPYLIHHQAIKRVMVLVLTSDRGLCGAFNNALCRRVQLWMGERPQPAEGIALSFWGKRGVSFFQNRVEVKQVYPTTGHRPDFAEASRMGADMQAAFLSREADEVYLAYNSFESVLRQVPKIQRLLPMDHDLSVKTQNDWLCEPVPGEILTLALPRLVDLRIFNAMLSSAAGEHAARMTAMENATRNADEVIDQNTLMRNRARQSAITRELIEIVAGAESLK